MPSDKPSETNHDVMAGSRSLPEQQPRQDEAEISPQNQDVLLQIASLIRLAEGFRLGFVKCNQPIQCRQNADRLKEMLAGEKAIISVQLHEPVTSLRRAVLQALKPDRPDRAEKSAIMIFGFEHSMSSSGPAPALDELNQSREIFPKSFSCPVLIWLPDYALTRLAREAPDFWGWRSGVFELAPELGIIASVENMAFDDTYSDSLSLSEKIDRASALEGLIRDYQELSGEERMNRSLATVLYSLGDIRFSLGQYSEASRLYMDSLKAFQYLGDKNGISMLFHQLGNLAYVTGDISGAGRLYQMSLKISQDMGDKSGVSASLHQLGMLAQVTGDLVKARQYYQEGLKIFQEMGDKSGVSDSLRQLGMLAEDTGNLAEARRLYQESLKISQDLSDKSSVSKSLGQLGNLAYITGDLGEARRLYQESLKIKQYLGNKSGVSVSLHQLGNLAYVAGDLGEARRLYQESLKISQELGDKNGVALSLHQLGILAQANGDLDEARRFYHDSLKIFQDMGIKSGIAHSQAQQSLLEEKEGNFDTALELIRKAESTFLELNSPIAAQVKADRQRLENKVKKSNDKK